MHWDEHWGVEFEADGGTFPLPLLLRCLDVRCKRLYHTNACNELEKIMETASVYSSIQSNFNCA